MADSNRDKWIRGTTVSAGVLVSVALFAMVNYLAMRHYERWDWTSTELFSLSEKSKNVIAGVDRDIDAVVFLSPGSEVYDQVDELLSRYAALNPRITKREVDPVRNRLEAQQLVERFGIDRNNVVVLATDDDKRVLDELDFAEYDYSGAQFGQGPTLKAFKGEQLITSAILELVENAKPKVLFTTGHGEASIDGAGDARGLSAARDLLGEDNFEIDSWSSLGQIAVPTDTDLLVIAGPTSSFVVPELEVFGTYLQGGGRMLFLLDPAFSESGTRFVDLGLGDWLRGYGVALGEDIVIDPAQQIPLYGAETIFSADYGPHPIVEPLDQTQRPVLLPLVRSVSPADDAEARYQLTELVLASAQSWGETDLTNLEDLAQDEGERGGPVSLGIAVSFAVEAERPGNDPQAVSTSSASASATTTASADDPAAVAGDGTFAAQDDAAESRLVVFGDADFAGDAQIANGANAALLLNTLNWLIEREQLVAIEPRRPEQTNLTLTSDEVRSIWWLSLLLMPGAAIAAGVMVYLRRRR